MSHSAEEISYFTPHNVFQLADISELPVLEDAVAFQIDPDMSPSRQLAWAARDRVADLVRPPKFNGRITDINLTVMEKPYEQLITARERGWIMPGGSSSYKRLADTNIGTIPDYVGLVMTASAKSTGRGEVGQIQAELFYYPAIKIRTSGTGAAKNYDASLAPYGGRSVHRTVTVSRLETEKFIELHNTATKIGMQTLRYAMKHPVQQNSGQRIET